MAATCRFAVATHILTLLACPERGAHAGALVSSGAIAESVNTHPVVIRRLLAELGRAKLVVCQVGKGGGVRLARPAARITLLDVYLAVGDAELFMLNPNPPDPRCVVSRRMARALVPVFSALHAELRAKLRKTKISQLVTKVATKRSG